MAQGGCAGDHLSVAELLEQGKEGFVLAGVAAPEDDPLHSPLLDCCSVIQQDLPINPAAKGDLARCAVGD